MSEADEGGEDEGSPEALRPGLRFFDCGSNVRRDMMEMPARLDLNGAGMVDGAGAKYEPILRSCFGRVVRIQSP